jgi:hypothetical protein
VPPVPEVPLVPVVPEVPVVPLVPEVPLVADVPLLPLEPLVPLVPVVPLVPDVPDVPSIPEEPEVPVVPDDPDVALVPDVPVVPDVPLDPLVPDEPLVPVVPLVPLVALVPLVPLLPLDPLDPLVPEVPVVPDVPEVPVVPLVAEVPEVPVVPLEPDVELDPLDPELPEEPDVPLLPLVPAVPDVVNGTFPKEPSPFMYCPAVPTAVIFIVPAAVTGGVVTENAIGTETCTLVTVPTLHVLFAERSYVVPLIVSVLVLGTGVYPMMLNMSNAVIGVADVTSPFAFTENFRAVFEAYTLALTVDRVSVVNDPVNPVPKTSPANSNAPAGKDTGADVILVTSPFELTVTTGTVVLPP